MKTMIRLLLANDAGLWNAPLQVDYENPWQARSRLPGAIAITIMTNYFLM
jgi:hypothetical protein